MARLLGAVVADGWVSFPGALAASRGAVAADRGCVRWGAWLFVLDDPRTLVGWGGFKGPPHDGAVELAYEIAPGWRGQGLASAAVEAMLAEAFGVPEVQAVVAHTLAATPPCGCSRRPGFRRAGDVVQDPVGTAWRHLLDRPV